MNIPMRSEHKGRLRGQMLGLRVHWKQFDPETEIISCSFQACFDQWSKLH
jgi:hypothetical protein